MDRVGAALTWIGIVIGLIAAIAGVVIVMALPVDQGLVPGVFLETLGCGLIAMTVSTK